jgi:O-antigen biosynthesis protein
VQLHDEKPREWNVAEADEKTNSRRLLAVGEEEVLKAVSATERGSWNPLRHAICLSPPVRSGTFSAWKEHVPFGMLLVDLVRPRVLLELGTHSGESYCAFCQAVRELRLPTRCYAIDTWKGDPQTGFYGPEVLDGLHQHHDPLYGSFSLLIQSTFDDALEHFADASIDLLHLDGIHTYEGVQHDFQSWLPKLSARAVVIFHDTNVREGNFGVHRFWREVREKYASFEFPFCHGLGVLAVGDHVPRRLRSFLRTAQSRPAIVNSFFHQLGQGNAVRTRAAIKEAVLKNHIGEQARVFDEMKNGLQLRLQEAEKRASGLENKISNLEEAVSSAHRNLRTAQQSLEGANADRDEKERLIRTLKDQGVPGEATHAKTREELLAKDRVIQELFDIIAQKDAATREITHSTAWSLVKTLRGLRLSLAPSGTRRERIWKKLVKQPGGIRP